MTTPAQLCCVLFTLILPVTAHIALWDPAMYGWDESDPNQSEPVLPLMDLAFNDWWFHGYINKPPADNTFMSLPAGGTYHGQVACNKALTTYGQNAAQQTGIYACDGDGASGGIGAMHTSDAWGSSNPQDVKGCGIAIAYESDVSKIQPEDFAVISVNHTCPWFKHVDFQIPSDLPACPEGGCHCMWGWVHAADAGSEQNYFLGYRCNVTGATGVTPLPAAQTANKCDYPTDTSNCTVGAKQPHYWFQKERNNNPQGTYDPPFYNGAYGFMDGAQTDLFAAAAATTTDPANASSTSVSAPASSSAASSAASAIVQPASSASSTVGSAATSASPEPVTTATVESTAAETSSAPSASATPAAPSSESSPASASASPTSEADAANATTTSQAVTTSQVTMTRTTTMYWQSVQTAASSASSAEAAANTATVEGNSTLPVSAVDANSTSSTNGTVLSSPSDSPTPLLSATEGSNTTEITTTGTCAMRKRARAAKSRRHTIRRRERERTIKRAVGGRGGGTRGGAWRRSAHVRRAREDALSVGR